MEQNYIWVGISVSENKHANIITYILGAMSWLKTMSDSIVFLYFISLVQFANELIKKNAYSGEIWEINPG